VAWISLVFISGVFWILSIYWWEGPAFRRVRHGLLGAYWYLYSASAEYCQYTSRKDPTSNGYCSAPYDTQREHLWKEYRVSGFECCNIAEGCNKDVIG